MSLFINRLSRKHDCPEAGKLFIYNFSLLFFFFCLKLCSNDSSHQMFCLMSERDEENIKNKCLSSYCGAKYFSSDLTVRSERTSEDSFVRLRWGVEVEKALFGKDIRENDNSPAIDSQPRLK